jgi:hypothetical protein
MAKILKPDVILSRQRVAEMVRLRIQGESVAKCFQFAENQGWDVTQRSLYSYVERADKLIAKQVERRQTQLIAWGVNQRNKAVDMALEHRQFEVALKIMQDREKLLGLYPSEKAPAPPVQVNNVIPPLTESQRIALDAALQRRLGQSGAVAVRERQAAGDGPVLPGAGGDPERRGETAGPVAEGTSRGAAAGDVITVQPAEQPVPPVRRTEQPVLAGPPGPGEERSVCLECGRRYLRQQPGVVFRCPACNAP